LFNIEQNGSYRFRDRLWSDTCSFGPRWRHIPQRIRARFRGKGDAKRIDHINCQQDSREAKSLEDGSYHVGMLHAPFKVSLTLTVAKDGYETFVKHFNSADHLQELDMVLERESIRANKVPSSTLATTYL
jgi:hypothetical protein